MATAFGFTDLHWAGRFDASLPARRQASRLVQRYSALALRTEQRGLDVILGENATRWGSQGGETKIVWHRDRWHRKDKGSVHIPSDPWKRGTSRVRGLDIPWVFLEHVHGFTVFRFGGHTPAHFDEPGQERANVQIIEGLENALKPLIASLSPNVAEGSFDFNRNLAAAKNVRLINNAVEGLGMHLIAPGFKTGEVNPIDGVISTRKNRHIVKLPWVRPDYDHRGFVLAAT